MRSNISAVGYSWEPWRRLRLLLAHGFGAGPNDLVMGEYNLSAAVIYGDRYFLEFYSAGVEPDVLMQSMELACELGPLSLPNLLVASIDDWPEGVRKGCGNEE